MALRVVKNIIRTTSSGHGDEGGDTKGGDTTQTVDALNFLLGLEFRVPINRLSLLPVPSSSPSLSHSYEGLEAG